MGLLDIWSMEVGWGCYTQTSTCFEMFSLDACAGMFWGAAGGPEVTLAFSVIIPEAQHTVQTCLGSSRDPFLLILLFLSGFHHLMWLALSPLKAYHQGHSVCPLLYIPYFSPAVSHMSILLSHSLQRSSKKEAVWGLRL